MSIGILFRLIFHLIKLFRVLSHSKYFSVTRTSGQSQQIGDLNVKRELRSSLTTSLYSDWILTSWPSARPPHLGSCAHDSRALHPCYVPGARERREGVSKRRVEPQPIRGRVEAVGGILTNEKPGSC